VAPRSSGAEWASVVVGLMSVLTIPVAVYVTRYVESYDLIDAGYAVPVGGVLGLAAVALSRRARKETAVRLGRGPQDGAARAGSLLAIAGICIALAGVVSLAVYGLLEYAGSH
jgi:ammonia channel protein AmtB